MDISRYRHEFDVVENFTFFNHASVAAPPRRARRALTEWADEIGSHGVEAEQSWMEVDASARERTARLLGVSAKEIALVENTSTGLSLVAAGLSWKPGDQVATCRAEEYPSNVFPWLHLADHGVEVREIAPIDGGVTVDAVERVLTERTRLVSVSAVQFASGHRTPLAKVGELCASHDVLLCVDGIQQLGAFDIRPKECGVHFITADSHKWMLGFPGIGVLYVDEALCAQMRPALVGWKSVRDPFTFDSANFILREDAARFEAGSLAWGLIAGMDKSLELIEEIGIERISTRIRSLLERAASGLARLGCKVGPAPADRAGILTFAPPAGELESLFDSLKRAGFSLSMRRGRLRISPHFYNTDEEIDRLLATVAESI
ncbi:MAG: hypothetical protein A2289_18980 [Deltaproteobacteria bacterium RIFOXYA12_FULL_58_15]|nr:MAG: hypothetical protein A2289_18980 [Deltaproteobacteria bacterium RIFOXYA12_FULL_58_15]OGR11079.1 MAG: hypothetical protein A2341_08035 [Deltaproteobacteria bacterium RIFOXYB12_FULL_58_9]